MKMKKKIHSNTIVLLYQIQRCDCMIIIICHLLFVYCLPCTAVLVLVPLSQLCAASSGLSIISFPYSHPL